MDRNSIIGFGLLLVLLIGYIAYTSNEKNKYEAQKRADSTAAAKITPLPAKDTARTIAADSNRAVADTALAVNNAPSAYRGEAKTVTLDNKLVTLTFSTKGAFPIAAELKEYKTYEQKPLEFFNGEGNEFSFVIPGTDAARTSADVYFEASEGTEANGSKSLRFSADLGEGKTIVISYILPADDYMMQCNIQTTGMPTSKMQMLWQNFALLTERDIKSERNNSQVHFRYKNKDHDYFTIRDEKKEESDLQWVAFRTHYFTSVLVNNDGFGKAVFEPSVNLDDNITAKNRTLLELTPIINGSEQDVHLSWYIGPNKYKTLKKYDLGIEAMVPLGYGVMAFVKYINIWLIIPVFDFLSNFISNYGIIIMLLTIFIRLILSFFTYKSYLSSAKMRVLKPELDELRAKIGDDQQKMGMEQMKLYRSAGVNPLGGCLPMLFQMPILFAMYYFFPSAIELRQKSFLWADDLSTYDSILSWNTHIPLLSSVYGNHISLFTLLMTASSLFLALYNRNMTQGQDNNPMLKYMPYIFPIMLLGVFNKMAAALTFYYFFSNLVSILQQFIIQKFIIDEKKLHAQIQENKNKPAAGSKWQQKLEEMQKLQAERAKQMPRKNN